MFCTQCEAEGFRRITYFPDRPDVLALYRVVIRADKSQCPVLLSNGNPVSTRDIDLRRIEAVWHDPHPKPSYLFALVAGDLACVSDQHTTPDGREIALNIYTVAEHVDRTEHAMASLKHAMHWDETRFGLSYDLDVFNVVAVDDFNMGAMENKGLNVFNTKYVLTDPNTATDSDYLGVESVVAHEYFHNWTGNRVTCRDWFQLSLKEGLTVFRDQEFSSDRHVRALKRIEDVRLLKSRQFPEDAGPMAHPIRPESYVEINNFYTLTVYEKGAEVVRLYQALLGESGFKRGMDLYIERHDGDAATCDDFRSAMADANGVDLSQFERWYKQAGTPVVRVESQYDSVGQCFTLTLTQSTPDTPGQADKPPLVIPIRMGLMDADGRALALRLRGETQASPERVLVLSDATEQFEFVDVPSEPVVSMLRGFSAPVNLDHEVPSAHRIVQLCHDSDEFNRWQVAQDLLAESICVNAERALQGRALSVPADLSSAFREVLGQTSLAAGLRAAMLTLPGIESAAARLDTFDIDAFDSSAVFLKQALASSLRDELDRVLSQPLPETYAVEPDQVGARSLRALALDWLCAVDSTRAIEQIEQQYHQANNMTDRLAALRIVVHSTDATCEAMRQALLEDFERRFEGDKLVIDKWYALQASSPRESVLEEIRALQQRADFDIRNPNRARALYSAFAFNNPVRFHAADGSGYRALCEFVAEYDHINPQTSARLAGAMASWRRHTASRQAHAKSALTALLQRHKLSRDVWEIVTKTLDGE
ncbi:MAG: aminopeptidase N [Pseudomonadota bacterium]